MTATTAPLPPAAPRRPARHGSHPGDPSGRRWLTRITVATIITAVLLPLVPLVLASFSRGYFHPQVVPETWSLRAWTSVLAAGADTWPALGASLVVAGAVTLVAVALGLPAGRALGLYRFRGRRVVEFVLLTPVLVPPIAIALGLHGVFLRLGLTGSGVGVVLVHLVPVLPYVVLILAGAFANLDPDYEDQARSLGAGRLAVLRTVTLPSIGPGLATAALFGFLVSWGQYALTLVIGGGRVVTLPILLFASAAGGDTAITSALALFATLPAVAILIINARAVDDRGASLGGVR